jgi:organic radical activating enzyme
VSLDIKLPSTGVIFTKDQIAAIYAIKCQHSGTQVKVVISDEKDLQWVYDNLYDFINPLSKSSPLILTPNSPFIKNGKQEPAAYLKLMQMIIDWSKGYNIVAIPQIHKLLDLDNQV